MVIFPIVLDGPLTRFSKTAFLMSIISSYSKGLIALQRSPTVEELRSSEQAGFRRRSTRSHWRLSAEAHDQDRNRFPRPYCCLWYHLAHSPILVKLSRCMEPWFVQLVELLLRNRRFKLHIESFTSLWRLQKNGLPPRICVSTHTL